MSNEKGAGFGGLIQGGLELLRFAHDEVVRKSQQTIGEYLGRLSPEVDAGILKERDAGLRFISGEVVLALIDDDNIGVVFDLYFKDAAGAWVRRSVSSRPVKMEWVLLPNEQAKVRAAKSLKFAYESP